MLLNPHHYHLFFSRKYLFFIIWNLLSLSYVGMMTKLNFHEKDKKDLEMKIKYKMFLWFLLSVNYSFNKGPSKKRIIS